MAGNVLAVREPAKQVGSKPGRAEPRTAVLGGVLGFFT